MVGLLPFFMIILITTSLSSETKRDARWLDLCTVERTQFMLSANLLSAIGDFVFSGLVLCDRSLGARGSDTITKHHRVSAGIPSNLRPASSEIISTSVPLCDSSLFLTCPAHWTKRVASENTQHCT